MKTFLTSGSAVLALLALSGCATLSPVTSTESDGIYYSSKDQTTENPVYAQAMQNRNLPDVPSQANDTQVPATNYSDDGTTVYADDYYDYDYAARLRRFHQPSYWSFAPGYYSYAYTNSWDPWFYDSYAYSPWANRYGYYNGFDPYYGYGGYYGGPVVSINIGNPYYRPYWGGWGGWGGWGYRTGYYNGYYNGYYGGYNNGYYDNGGNPRNGSRGNVHYGPRRDRSTSNLTGTGVSSRGRLAEGGATGGRGTAPTTSPSTGGLVSEGGRATSRPAERPIPARGRTMETSTSGMPTRIAEPTPETRPARVAESVPGRAETPILRPAPEARPEMPAEQPTRRRVVDVAPSEESRPQRVDVPTPAPEPRRARAERPSRSYEQPSRSYEQPSRSYEQPSRSSSPSSSPAGGGGSRGRGRVQ